MTVQSTHDEGVEVKMSLGILVAQAFFRVADSGGSGGPVGLAKVPSVSGGDTAT